MNSKFTSIVLLYDTNRKKCQNTDGGGAKRRKPLVLLSNINPEKGLCNGTRLLIHRIGQYVLQVKVPGPDGNERLELIPRFTLSTLPSEHYDWKLGRSVANIFMILVDIQPILLVEMRQAFFESTHKVKHLPSWMVTAFPFYSSYIPFLLAKYIMSALFWA